MTSVGISESPPSAERKRSSVLKNVTSTWASLLSNILLSFFLAPYIVNSLGNVYYGIWSLVIQFTGYLWLFDFGVRESVIKYVAQYHASDRKDDLVSTVDAALTLYALIGALTMGAAGVLAYALPYFFNIPPEAVETARITLLLTAATVAQGFVVNVFVGVLMGLQRFYLVARTNIVFSVIRAALVLLFLWAGYGIVALATIHLVSSLATSVWVYRYTIAHLPYLSPRLVRPRRDALTRIVSYGKYVLVTNVGEKLVFATDAVVIGAFLPISMLTYYTIPVSLVTYLKSFIGAMAAVLNPMSSAFDAKNDARSLSMLAVTSAKSAVLVGMPVCIGFIILGERFINLWMGPEYGPISGPILAVLGVTHLIGLPQQTIVGILYGLGRHKITAYVRIVEAIANVVLSVVLVQIYGLIGVAVGTLIPHVIIVAGVLPLVLPRLAGVSLRDYYDFTYVRSFVAAIPFWLLCLLIDRVLAPEHLVTFLAEVGTALIGYALPCWFLVLRRHERSQILQRFRRIARR